MLRYLALLCLLAWPHLAGAQETVPQTLEEAFQALDEMLPPNEIQAFRQRPEREAVVLQHMGLGMYIRNAWFRSGKSRLVGMLHSHGAGHLDDMSSMILTSYWRRLNGQPIDIERQGACYRRWWAEQHRIKAAAKANNQTSYGVPSFRCP
jgi:hypothetical protein